MPRAAELSVIISILVLVSTVFFWHHHHHCNASGRADTSTRGERHAGPGLPERVA